MIMRMMARNSVSENLQQRIDASVKGIATEAYDVALGHIRWVVRGAGRRAAGRWALVGGRGAVVVLGAGRGGAGRGGAGAAVAVGGRCGAVREAPTPCMRTPSADGRLPQPPRLRLLAPARPRPCRDNREAIDRIVEVLLEKESMTGDEFRDILGQVGAAPGVGGVGGVVIQGACGGWGVPVEARVREIGVQLAAGKWWTSLEDCCALALSTHSPPPAPHTLTTPPAPLRTAPPAPTAVRDHPRGAHGGGGAHEAARPRARPRLKQQQQQQQQRPTPTLSSPLPVCRRPACEPRPVDTTRCLRRLPSAGRAARDPPECAAPSPPPPSPTPCDSPMFGHRSISFPAIFRPFHRSRSLPPPHYSSTYPPPPPTLLLPEQHFQFVHMYPSVSDVVKYT